jgi:hypothetical protein
MGVGRDPYTTSCCTADGSGIVHFEEERKRGREEERKRGREEEKIGKLLDAVAVGNPVVTEQVAVVPDLVTRLEAAEDIRVSSVSGP